MPSSEQHCDTAKDEPGGRQRSKQYEAHHFHPRRGAGGLPHDEFEMAFDLREVRAGLIGLTEGAAAAAGGPPEPAVGTPVLGMRPRTALALLSLASFLCCVPMAMPQGHLVAFCSDVGIPLTHGSAMLSVLLACAFIGRQFWGFVADRYGGLRAILAGSACQATAMIGFLLTQNEAGLFVVSAAFELGFGGIIPAYVLAIRELFPASEASWRVPTLLLCSGSGMAVGGWMAGAIYESGWMEGV